MGAARRIAGRGSGQRRLGDLCHAVQLEVEFGAVLGAAGPQAGYFRFELADPAAEPTDLESKDLLVLRADVSQQGACHVAEPFAFPAYPCTGPGASDAAAS